MFYHHYVLLSYKGPNWSWTPLNLIRLDRPTITCSVRVEFYTYHCSAQREAVFTQYFWCTTFSIFTKHMQCQHVPTACNINHSQRSTSLSRQMTKHSGFKSICLLAGFCYQKPFKRLHKRNAEAKGSHDFECFRNAAVSVSIVLKHEYS